MLQESHKTMLGTCVHGGLSSALVEDLDKKSINATWAPGVV